MITPLQWNAQHPPLKNRVACCTCCSLSAFDEVHVQTVSVSNGDGRWWRVKDKRAYEYALNTKKNEWCCMFILNSILKIFAMIWVLFSCSKTSSSLRSIHKWVLKLIWNSFYLYYFLFPLFIVSFKGVSLTKVLSLACGVVESHSVAGTCWERVWSQSVLFSTVEKCSVQRLHSAMPLCSQPQGTGGQGDSVIFPSKWECSQLYSQ